MGNAGCCERAQGGNIFAGHCMGPRRTRLRIIAVNDVYQLTNFPRLKTLVERESVGFPKGNVLTTLAGDFLGPSLLSSLDSGAAMIKVMNQVPVDLVCFGNHDGNDVAYDKLKHRIEEYRGVWLNTNMPGFEPELPVRYLHEVASDDGQVQLRVAFLGLCVGGGKHQAMYRDTAFGGAHRFMCPVLEAARTEALRCKQTYPDLGAVIPLTHQDMPDDIELAETELFPVVIAGHDHERMHEIHGACKCHIVKAGQDATEAAIVDIEWPEADVLPQISVSFRTLADVEPDRDLEEQVEGLMAPVRELEKAVLYELAPDEHLSSVGSKYHDCSLARMLASAIRDCLGADAAVVNSGAVRGNKAYEKVLSFGDLKAECPYPSTVVVARMPFAVLQNAVRHSRRTWADGEASGKTEVECNSALQTDDGMEVVEHAPTTIRGAAPEAQALYSVACDTYFLKKNPVFKEYCASYPERIPPADAGRPLLPILVEHFCQELWRKLVNSVGGDTSKDTREMLAEHLRKAFVDMDENHDGQITVKELRDAMQARLGENLSSDVIIAQMMQLMDTDGDMCLTPEELRNGFLKVMHLDS